MFLCRFYGKFPNFCIQIVEDYLFIIKCNLVVVDDVSYCECNVGVGVE